MIIHSDWHIHSDASYDSALPLDEIYNKSREFGFKKVGITDHLNYNDTSFVGDLHNSVKNVGEFQKDHPDMILGVELTPIAVPEFEYIKKTGTRDGFTPDLSKTPYDIELAMTKEELTSLGVKYAIGASHWRVDIPKSMAGNSTLDELINEWYRQQMWLACDERVTILGHPWYNGRGIWYEDFTVIPRSMHLDIAAALKENGKYVECNSHFFNTQKTEDKFRTQYADFLREMFEMGIPVVYGSDSHNEYKTAHIATEQYLEKAGFKDGDIVGLTDKDFWK